MSEQPGKQDGWQTRVEELIERLRQDAGYCEQIEADPAGELERLGLPGPVQDDILRGIEVEMRCQVTCIKGSTECTRSVLV